MKRGPEIAIITLLVAVVAVAVFFRGNSSAGAGSDTEVQAPEDGFAIRNVRVFDGTEVMASANVVIRDGRIAAVGSQVEIPADVPSIDGTGKTLLPGLIDAHVHAWGDAQRDMLRFGVTSALDLHGAAERLPALREQRQLLSNASLADLWASGYAITAPGGHGTQYGFPVPTVDATTDIDAFIGERVAEGAEFIKLIIEDMSAYGAVQRIPTLTPEQVRQVVAAAHARDRLAVAHVSTQADARVAIDAGSDGLVHVFSDAVTDEAFVASMVEHKAFIVPTLAVIASTAGSGEGKALVSDPRIQPLLTTEQTGTLSSGFGGAHSTASHPERLQRAIESVRRLHAAGVDILAGSDAPNPGTAHGASLHHELELLVRAGLSPAQALAAATSLPAKHFDLAERGRISPGMRADLVLVEGNPLDDITATRAIVTVWKNGHRVQRQVAAATPQAGTAPADTRISDFESGEVAANFGSWQPTTDQMAGGASMIEHAIVEGGAGDSQGALRIAGEVKRGFSFPWSGMMFFPASQPMQPVDFSARKELVFRARGDGRSYNAMLFSGPSAQGMPSMQAFVAGPEWTEVRLPLEGFAGADLAQLRGIAFTAGQPLGTFEFMLDDVEIR